MKKKIIRLWSMILITTLLLAGCSNAVSGTQTSGTATTSTTTESTGDTQTTVTDSAGDSQSATATTLSSTSTIAVDTEFTANDLEVGYEEEAATQITLSGNTISVSGDGATVDGSTLTITAEGSYVVTGTLQDGQIIIDAGDSDKVQLILNNVDITCQNSAPIYVKNADKVFITLPEGTENTLTDGSTYVQSDDNTVDAVIFSKSDLTLNGTGSLNINANYKHGIACKDELVFTGGVYNITAVKDAINGKDCVKIKDGTFTLASVQGNGIQSKNADDTTQGYVYIKGGTITITESQEGIEGTAIVIEGGDIDITSVDDGMNAASASSESNTDNTAAPMSMDTTDTTATAVTLAATTDTSIDTTNNAVTDASTATTTGDTTATAITTGRMGTRAGFGGGGGMENDTNCYISISGGNLQVNAQGDGIDSNGSVYISGGTIYVSGPTDSGNGSFDYNGTAEITGGTTVFAGSSGMAQGFSDTSSQNSILYNFSSVSAAGTEITLTDADGNTVISYTPEKEYQSVVISSPDLTQGTTYAITSGSQTAEVTLSSVVTSGGEQSTGGMHGGFGRKGF